MVMMWWAVAAGAAWAITRGKKPVAVLPDAHMPGGGVPPAIILGREPATGKWELSVVTGLGGAVTGANLVIQGRALSPEGEDRSAQLDITLRRPDRSTIYFDDGFTWMIRPERLPDGTMSPGIKVPDPSGPTVVFAPEVIGVWTVELDVTFGDIIMAYKEIEFRVHPAGGPSAPITGGVYYERLEDFPDYNPYPGIGGHDDPEIDLEHFPQVGNF